jgi:hypothetical protein
MADSMGRIFIAVFDTWNPSTRINLSCLVPWPSYSDAETNRPLPHVLETNTTSSSSSPKHHDEFSTTAVLH